MRSVLQSLQEQIQAGRLHADPAQEAAAEQLSRLQEDLQDWKPGKGFRLFKRKAPPPQGLYVFGDVGRGKSMLMDLFFANVDFAPKRRVHFHEFMREVHASLNVWRKLDEAGRRLRPEHVRGAGDDPIPPVANGIAASAQLLCFDEFQVSDIADAMILGRLFEQLFARNVVVVATSNRPPDDLYKDGLNRHRFMPFIQMLKSRLHVMELAAHTDYRQGDAISERAWFISPPDAVAESFDGRWAALPGNETSRSLTIQGRDWPLPCVKGSAVRISFAETCEAARGAGDYLELAHAFHTVFLEGVPVLSGAERNAAKRFVTLIDALYEARTQLVVSAEAEPEELYREGDGHFEFARCASRLHEMRSHSWTETLHGGKGLVV